MPRVFAANVLFPPTFASTAWMWSASANARCRVPGLGATKRIALKRSKDAGAQVCYYLEERQSQFRQLRHLVACGTVVIYDRLRLWLRGG